MNQAERLQKLLAKHPGADLELKILLAATLLTKEQQLQLWAYLKALVPELAEGARP